MWTEQTIRKARRAAQILAGGVSHRIGVVQAVSPGRGGTISHHPTPTGCSFVLNPAREFVSPLPGLDSLLFLTGGLRHRLISGRPSGHQSQPLTAFTSCPPRIFRCITTSFSAPRIACDPSAQHGGTSFMLTWAASLRISMASLNALAVSMITSIFSSACGQRIASRTWCGTSKPIPRVGFTRKFATPLLPGRRAMVVSPSALNSPHKFANTSGNKMNITACGVFRRSMSIFSNAAWWNSTNDICGEAASPRSCKRADVQARRAVQIFAGGVSHRIMRPKGPSPGRGGTHWDGTMCTGVLSATVGEFLSPLPGLIYYRGPFRWLTPPANFWSALRASTLTSQFPCMRP